MKVYYWKNQTFISNVLNVYFYHISLCFIIFCYQMMTTKWFIFSSIPKSINPQHFQHLIIKILFLITTIKAIVRKH